MSRDTILPAPTALPSSPPEPHDTDPEGITYVDLVLVTIDASARVEGAVAVRRPPGNYAYALMPLAAVRELGRFESIHGEPELWDGKPFAVDGGGVWLDTATGDSLAATGSLAHLDGAVAIWSPPAKDPALCRALEDIEPRDRLAVKALCAETRAWIKHHLRETTRREPSKHTLRLAAKAVTLALHAKEER